MLLILVYYARKIMSFSVTDLAFSPRAIKVKMFFVTGVGVLSRRGNIDRRYWCLLMFAFYPREVKLFFVTDVGILSKRSNVILCYWCRRSMQKKWNCSSLLMLAFYPREVTLIGVTDGGVLSKKSKVVLCVLSKRSKVVFCNWCWCSIQKK